MMYSEEDSPDPLVPEVNDTVEPDGGYQQIVDIEEIDPADEVEFGTYTSRD